LEHAVLEYQPDFAVADSLQSLAGYNSKAVVNTLVRIQAVARKHRLPLIVVGEERKDRSTYLGSAHISHIVEVIMKLEKGLDDEVIISTPEKNRDTDDRTSRCFFKRTPSGLVEIAEPTTGYLPRHTREAVAGLASFVTEAGNDYAVDEVTAIMEGKNSEGAKFSLSIDGMAV
jgi:predicted ATP-dependent serine protease